jgi:hypothetical protein
MAQVCTIASCMRQRDAGTGSLISFLSVPLPPTLSSFKRRIFPGERKGFSCGIFFHGNRESL